jgi:chromosomal replication initiation ATPase DnaA
MTIWDQILERLRPAMPPEEYRRWFIATAYASDSGDQISVWVPTEAVRRHIALHYHDEIDEALSALGRSDTQVRLIVGGLDEDDDEIDE